MNEELTGLSGQSAPEAAIVRNAAQKKDAPTGKESAFSNQNTELIVPPSEITPSASTASRSIPNVIPELKNFIKRFCFVQDDCIYELLALWIIMTYLYEVFDFVPYLFIHSPQKQSGKTRLLEVLDLIAHNSSGIQCSPTEAVLFRTAKGKTQLLDEADGWQNLSMLRSVLNSGFQRGGKVTRMQKEPNGNYKDVDCPTFGPRAIAGIGKQILGDTLLDRVYSIELVRQTDSERREKLRPRSIAAEVEMLKKKIKEWVNTKRDEVHQQYQTQKDYSYLSCFRDRTEDISDPLAAILEVAYKDDPAELQRARDDFAKAVAKTRSEEHNSDIEHERAVLQELHKHLIDEELKVQPCQIVEWCKAYMPELNEYKVGEILRKYSLGKHGSSRINGEPKKCYTVNRARVEDMLKRYEEGVSRKPQ